MLNFPVAKAVTPGNISSLLIEVDNITSRYLSLKILQFANFWYNNSIGFKFPVEVGWFRSLGQLHYQKSAKIWYWNNLAVLDGNKNSRHKNFQQ